MLSKYVKIWTMTKNNLMQQTPKSGGIMLVQPRKHRALIVSILAAVFAAFALVVTCHIVLAVRVSAADDTVVGELNSAEHFNISNGVLSGLSSAGSDIANASTALHVTIPDGVTAIADKTSSSYLFGSLTNNQKVTVLTFPSSLTQIGNYAFYKCSGLTSIDLSGATSLTSIGDYAFQSCSGLTSIAIPSSVISIGSNAFSGCSGLTSVNYLAPLTNGCKLLLVVLLPIHYIMPKNYCSMVPR